MEPKGLGIVLAAVLLAGSCGLIFGCSDNPQRELALVLATPPEKLGPVDPQLVLDIEASVSAFLAVALDDGEIRRIGSMNKWHYQDYKVLVNIFGRKYRGRITLENAISPGGVAMVTPEMLRVKKGDRVIALVHFNFGWSRGDKGSLMITRTLADIPGNRRRLAAALKALPTSFVAPIPAWAGERIEAVITPDLKALHADGASVELLRYRGCKSWMYPFSDSNLKFRRLDRITVDTRPWSRYATIEYRRAKAPVSFQVDYPNDPKRVSVVFPDYGRLSLFGVGFTEFQKACLDSMPKNHGGYPNRVRIRIHEDTTVRVGDLSVAILADKELYRRAEETTEQWERRIIEVVKSRPEKFNYGPRPKSSCYDELSRLHGLAGLDLLWKIGGAHDPLASKYAAMDRAEIK